MTRTKDTQLRAIYEKFNKFRKIEEESNILSEQMNPREKRQLEASFRAIETNIDYIKKEVKIISKLLMKQGMRKSVGEIQGSFKRKVVEFGLDVRNIARQHLNKEGSLYFEINENYSAQIISILHKARFVNIQLKKDINQKDRMIKAVLK